MNQTLNEMKHTKPHGSGEWLVERGLALACLPFLVWFIYCMIFFVGGNSPHNSLHNFLSITANMVMMIVFLGCFNLYATLAMKVVFEDYISKVKVRNAVIKIMYLISAAAFLGSVYSILVIGKVLGGYAYGL